MGRSNIKNLISPEVVFRAYSNRLLRTCVLITCVVLQSLIAHSQVHYHCGAALQDSLLKARNPEYRLSRERLNQLLLQKPSNRSVLRTSGEKIVIPIVVHVIHNNSSNTVGGNTNGNISDEQIRSQIEVLNEDYQRRPGTPGFNTNPVGTGIQIEFRLASLDPNGQPSNGITRHYSKQSTFMVSEVDKLADIVSWPTNRYLNIWVTNVSGDFIGFSQFPDISEDILGLARVGGLSKTDGIVIDHHYFGRQTGTASSGSYSHGRTTTHEIGHWLGLLHTWGDEECGTDYCDDTPPAFAANNATGECPDIYSECTGVQTRNMIENYMDYSADECMNIFTKCQIDRIYRVMEVSPRRRQLIENASSAFRLEVTLFPNPGPDLATGQIKLQVRQTAGQYVQVEIYSMTGKQVAAKNFASQSDVEIALDVPALANGLYIVKIRAVGEEIIKKLIIAR